jgi:MFS family permease
LTYNNDQNIVRKTDNSVLSVLMLAVFIDILGFGIVFPLLPFWTSSLGASALIFGLLLATYSLFQFVFSPIWGRLSDRIGRRPILLLGLTGTFFSFILLLLTSLFFNSIEMIFLSRLLGGIFTAATLPTSQAYISDTTTGSERTRSFGYLGASMALALTLGPAFGGILAGIGVWILPNTNGYWAPALFASILSFINLIGGILRLKETKTRNKVVERTEKRSRLYIFKIFRQNPTILVIISIFASINLAFASLDSVLALFGEARFGMNEILAGIVFMTAGIIMIIVQGGLLGKLTKYGEKNLISIGILILVISFLGISTVTSFVEAIFWAIPVAIGISISQPTIQSLLSKTAPKHIQGEIMGLNESTNALMRVFGPIVATLSFGINIALPWYIGAGVLLVALLITLMVSNNLTKYQFQIKTESVATTGD